MRTLKFQSEQGFQELFLNKCKIFLGLSKTVFVAILVIFFTSCSPIKRHAKLVEKYPFVHTQDTVILIDTIRVEIPKIEHDTIVHFEQLKDTVILEKENLVVRVHTILDSVFIEGECKEIIVEKIVEKKVPVRYYKEVNDHTWLKYIIVFSIVLFTLYSIFRKR